VRGVELRETPFPGRAVFLSRCRACVSGGDHQGVVGDEGRVACRGGRDAPDDLGHPTYPGAVYVVAHLASPSAGRRPDDQAQLAQATQAHEPSLYRALRLLARWAC
jgi:hypothetical protein